MNEYEYVCRICGRNIVETEGPPPSSICPDCRRTADYFTGEQE